MLPSSKPLIRAMNLFSKIFHSGTKTVEKEDKGNGISSLPDTWKKNLPNLENRPVPYLVMLSLGHAVEGRSEPPPEEYATAVRLFNQAKDENDVANVLKLLFQACEKQPASAKTYNLIGACYRHLDQPEMALPFLWQALKLKPEYDYALTNLGLCSQSLGIPDSARFYFEHEAVKKSSSNWVKESYAKFLETIY